MAIIDRTTAWDLAEKIRWVGFANLSRREKLLVDHWLEEVSRHLPETVAGALWRYSGREAAEDLETLSEDADLENRMLREQGQQFISMLLMNP